jgi:hypothetical protein
VDVAYRVAKITTVHGNSTDAKSGDIEPQEKLDGSNWPFDYLDVVPKIKVGFWF